MGISTPVTIEFQICLKISADPESYSYISTADTIHSKGKNPGTNKGKDHDQGLQLRSWS